MVEKKSAEELGWEATDKMRELANQIHPEAFVFPLYRSLFAVIPQDKFESKDGRVKLYGYSDPGFLGKERTIETMIECRTQYVVKGSREGLSFTQILNKVFELELIPTAVEGESNGEVDGEEIVHGTH